MAKVQRKGRRAAMEVGSGNVFVADLGLPDADELKTKVQLAVAIKREITARGWSRAEAGEVLDINQPKVSSLLQYRLDGFSV
jgi:predicted XRE-type DNA-binding protein